MLTCRLSPYAPPSPMCPPPRGLPLQTQLLRPLRRGLASLQDSLSRTLSRGSSANSNASTISVSGILNERLPHHGNIPEEAGEGAGAGHSGPDGGAGQHSAASQYVRGWIHEQE